MKRRFDSGIFFRFHTASGKNSDGLVIVEALCGDCSLLGRDTAESDKTLKMEAASFSETFVPFYHSTASHFPEAIDLIIHGCEHLSSACVCV
jgi:hypothetical protein